MPKEIPSHKKFRKPTVKQLQQKKTSNSVLQRYFFYYIKIPTFIIIIAIMAITLITYSNNAEYTLRKATFKKSAPIPQASHTLDKMTAQEYRQVKNDLTNIVITKDPKIALTQLQTLTNIDPKIIEYCHGLAHEIGHATYEKYGFADALTFQDDVCGSGYIHGVIESYFTNTNDLKNKLHTVCQTGVLAMEEGNCYHGIGHGLMFYTKNNIPLSLLSCDSFTDFSQRSLCSEGVFMENFNSDIQSHPSHYLHPKDPFYPCTLQTDFYKNACYFYATDYYLHLHTADYLGAIIWCNSAEEKFATKCAMGVGSRTMKYNTGNPKFVEKVCMTANTKEKINSCIDGMISYFLVQYNSVSRAKNICSELKKENQTTCFQGTNNRKRFFN